MSSKKGLPIQASAVGNSKAPILKGGQDFKDNWSFSFEYFNQIRYFGLKDVDGDWFVSLIERLQEFSKMSVDHFKKSAGLRDGMRYHKIDWNAYKIPIQKSHLNWVRHDILNNDVDYPFYQFQVTTSSGRVIGFWDLNVFNIVLLDTLHNIQPSSYNDYKVRDSYPADCHYTSLSKDIDDLKNKTCNNPQCGYKGALQYIPSKTPNKNIIMAHLDDNEYELFQEVAGKASFSQILKDGVFYNIE